MTNRCTVCHRSFEPLHSRDHLCSEPCRSEHSRRYARAHYHSLNRQRKKDAAPVHKPRVPEHLKSSWRLPDE